MRLARLTLCLCTSMLPVAGCGSDLGSAPAKPPYSPSASVTVATVGSSGAAAGPAQQAAIDDKLFDIPEPDTGAAETPPEDAAATQGAALASLGPYPPSQVSGAAAPLVRIYRHYQLPLPPPDAPLVRVDGQARSQNPDGSETLHRHLGFLLPDNKSVLLGTFVYRPKSLVYERVAPTPEAAQGVVASTWGLGQTFPINASLATALQCADRGHTALAQALIKASLKESIGHHFGLFFQRADLTPPEAVHMLAWTHFGNRLLDPNSDRVAIHSAMKQLAQSGRLPLNPRMQNGQSLLDALAAAAKPSKAPSGSVEALIDDLTKVRARRGIMANTEPDPRYRRLLERGFDAVPALIAHVDDPRLTRAVRQGFNNFPSYHERVGGVVSDMLQDIAGQELGKNWLRRQQGYNIDPADVRAWWKNAQKRGEEQYLLDHILPSAQDAKGPQPGLLAIMTVKYPQHLPNVYRTILRRRPSLQSHPVADAIASAKLPIAIKRKVLSEAGTHTNPEHRRAAFWPLRRVDQDAFVNLLIKTVEQLPKTTEQPYWRSREAAFTQLVLKTESPRAWSALLRAAKRADVGLRMEIIQRMGYDRARPKKRLVFLRAFLNDRTTRSLADAPKRFDGPSAGFRFPTLSVRDLAAMTAAPILKMDAAPEASWSAKQWQALRKEVERRSRQVLGPHLR